MNLEMLDGFFAALIYSPDTVPPSEYLPEIWGGDIPDEALSDRGELQTFLDLVMRHWNAAVHTLHSEDVFLPLLLEDDEGVQGADERRTPRAIDRWSSRVCAGDLSLFCIASPLGGACWQGAHNAPAARSQDRSQRTLPLWIRQEVQEMLR